MRAEDGRSSIASVTLADWLDEYRSFAPESVVRTEAEPADDWHEQELMAPTDRLHDTSPRWQERARRIGYGRPTTIG